MRDHLSNLQTTLVAISALLHCACSSSTDPKSGKDLPTGWTDAKSVVDFVQAKCAQGTLDFGRERATFTVGTGSLAVDYEEAHFRCEQEVEGFYIADGDALNILVQPAEMHPAGVAGCDCTYGITFAIKPLVSGGVQATLYRRWDDWNEPNEPVEVASEQVIVE